MPTLSERKRRLIQDEVAATSLRLFREHGYEATTVDELAAAVGMSRRTFFRYFRSKEDVVAGKWIGMGENFLAALEQRSHEENAWLSLRRSLDGIVEHYTDLERRADSYALEETVAHTPALNSSFLVNVDAICVRASAILHQRGLTCMSATVMCRWAGMALVTAMEQARQNQEPGIERALDAAFASVRQLAVTLDV